MKIFCSGRYYLSQWGRTWNVTFSTTTTHLRYFQLSGWNIRRRSLLLSGTRYGGCHFYRSWVVHTSTPWIAHSPKWYFNLGGRSRNHPEGKWRVRKDFINGKIFKGMQNDLRDYVKLRDGRLTKDNLQDLLPTDLTFILVAFSRSLAPYRDTEVESRWGFHSSLHVTYRCSSPVTPRPTYHKKSKKSETKTNDETTYNTRPGQQKLSGQSYRFKQKKGSFEQ